VCCSVKWLNGIDLQVRCVAVCCSVLQCVAVCCSALQRVTVHIQECCSVNWLNNVLSQTGSTATLSRCKVEGNGQTGVLVSDQHTQVCMQHTATHCNTLQHTATHCDTLQHTHRCLTSIPRCVLASLFSSRSFACPRVFTLHHTATHCNTLQHTATRSPVSFMDCSVLNNVYCNILQHTAPHCTTLQHTATHCNTLYYSATQCTTLQHTLTGISHKQFNT